MDRLAELASGDVVKLFTMLPIPNRDLARFCCFTATVAWSNEAETGLSFTEVPVEAFAQLKLSIESLN